MSEIGEFIKSKREKAGFSQQNLAEACGLKHDSAINRIERGERKVSWDELGKISKALKNFHIFEALIVTGFISEEDLHPVCKLYHLDELNSDEIIETQKFIEFLLFKRRTENRED